MNSIRFDNNRVNVIFKNRSYGLMRGKLMSILELIRIS